MQPMDSKILQAIDKFSYPVWFVIRDENVLCPCINPTTKQPDPACPKCLGTGRKIKIRRMMAAHQNNRISLRGEGLGATEINIIGVYYTKNDTNSAEEDIIVDGNNVDIIQHAYAERTDHSTPVYFKYETVPKKANVKLFLSLFDNILRGAGHER